MKNYRKKIDQDLFILKTFIHAPAVEMCEIKNFMSPETDFDVVLTEWEIVTNSVTNNCSS